MTPQQPSDIDVGLVLIPAGEAHLADEGIRSPHP